MIALQPAERPQDARAERGIHHGHRLIRDEPMEPSPAASGAALLVALAREPRPGWRADGSENVDAYLREDERGA